MRTRARAAFLLLPLLVLAAPAAAQKKGATVAPPKLSVAIDNLLDRRSSADFPPASLDVALKLQGEDAASVLSVSTKVAKAEDDTGRNLLEGRFAQASDERWKEGREGEPPAPSCSLASPARKARTLAALSGTVSVYMPARDPGAVVTVEKVLANRDKPPVASAALAKEKVRIRVLSKEGLEKEKKAAEEKKKADAAKKKGKKAGGMEEVGEAMADAIGQIFERLFVMAGEHDLVLKVDDPGKKVFSFGLVGADGKPITSYGTTDIESYRIVRLLEPLPEGAALQVRLKTPRSFAEIPFQIADVKLP